MADCCIGENEMENYGITPRRLDGDQGSDENRAVFQRSFSGGEAAANRSDT
jgi:hypothetical protein